MQRNPKRKAVALIAVSTLASCSLTESESTEPLMLSCTTNQVMSLNEMNVISLEQDTQANVWYRDDLETRIYRIFIDEKKIGYLMDRSDKQLWAEFCGYDWSCDFDINDTEFRVENGSRTVAISRLDGSYSVIDDGQWAKKGTCVEIQNTF